MTEEENKDLQRVLLIVNRRLHELMKEYAKRKRIKIGLAYDNAMQFFLSQNKNYMGAKRSSQLKGSNLSGSKDKTKPRAQNPHFQSTGKRN